MLLRRIGYLLLAGHVAGTPAAAELDDPTRPVSLDDPSPVDSHAGHPGLWRLTILKHTPQTRSAVINGKLVREGDRIEGATVARIGAREVLLLRNGQRIRVTFTTNPVKSAYAATSKPVTGNAPRGRGP